MKNFSFFCVLFTAWTCWQPAMSAEVQFRDAVRIERGHLLHTTQLVSSGQKSVGSAVKDFIQQLDKLAQEHGTHLEDMVKLNLNCREEWRSKLPMIREELLKNQEIAKAQPAITLLPNAIPGKGDLAGDAVFNSPQKSPNSGTGCFIPPNHEILYVSGKVGKADNLVSATRKTIESLKSTLDSLGATPVNIVQIKAFINPMESWQAVQKAIAESLGKDVTLPPLVLVEWQWDNTEIELIASLPTCQTQRPDGLSIHTPEGESASPNFSRVSIVRSNELIYLSAIDSRPTGNPDEQTRALIRAQASALKKVGGNLHNLAKATYYVSSNEASRGLNNVRREFYDTSRPPAASKVMVTYTGGKGETHLMDLIAVPVE